MNHIRESLEWIYGRHRKGLFVLALSITRSAVDAEDVVHDAFARLLREPDRIPEDATAYVFAAVRNAAIDRVRRRSSDASILPAAGACLDASDRAATKERDGAVARAI